MNPDVVQLSELPEYGVMSDDLLALLAAAAVFDKVSELEVLKNEGRAPDELSRLADEVLMGVDVQSFRALNLMDAFAQRMLESGCCTSEQFESWKNSVDSQKNPEDMLDDHDEDDGHGHTAPSFGARTAVHNTRHGEHDEARQKNTSMSISALVLKYVLAYIKQSQIVAKEQK